jgi:hypothetical protein
MHTLNYTQNYTNTYDVEFDTITIAISFLFTTAYFSYMNTMRQFSILKDDKEHSPMNYDKYKFSVVYFTYKLILCQLVIFVLHLDTLVYYMNYVHVLTIMYDYLNSSAHQVGKNMFHYLMLVISLATVFDGIYVYDYQLPFSMVVVLLSHFANIVC